MTRERLLQIVSDIRKSLVQMGVGEQLVASSEQLNELEAFASELSVALDAWTYWQAKAIAAVQKYDALLPLAKEMVETLKEYRGLDVICDCKMCCKANANIERAGEVLAEAGEVTRPDIEQILSHREV